MENIDDKCIKVGDADNADGCRPPTHHFCHPMLGVCHIQRVGSGVLLPPFNRQGKLFIGFIVIIDPTHVRLYPVQCENP